MTTLAREPEPVATAHEQRILEGPNLFVTRPALKVTLAVPGLVHVDRSVALELATRVRLPGSRPGQAQTAVRQRYAMRLVAHLVRRVAAGAGVRRLTVHTRPGAGLDEIIVAVPWQRRGRAEAMGELLAPLLCSLAEPGLDREGADTLIVAAGARVAQAEPGPRATSQTPAVPVIAITGTNGKTTTTRLVAHIAMTAGLKTAWSSTDGVVVMGEMVRAGDYSGPGGAREVLGTDGLQVGILETARGGMLLKGMGVTRTDVTLVTNVAADHLGMQGIDTLDQLAEVKAIPTRVVRPGGWLVLNGDDPRVWAMRLRSKGIAWVFTLDPGSPTIREALAAGGRAMTVLDGFIVQLLPGEDPDRLVRVLDVPLTMSGLSQINIANALGAAAGALALGLPREAVEAGLREFRPDPIQNAGRFNTFSVPIAAGGEVTVIIDLAHNEPGLIALLSVCRGLTAPGARVHLGLGGAGDRAADAIVGMGQIAAELADHVVIAHKPKYARGRSLSEFEGLMRAGLGRGGVAEVDAYPSELDALAALVQDGRDGDVIGLMCHDQRTEVIDFLVACGGHVDDPIAIRRKVIRANGDHEAEAEIAAAHAIPNPLERATVLGRLAAGHPGDPRLAYEWALAMAGSGEADRAEELLGRAVADGLREPFRRRALAMSARLQLDRGAGASALGTLAQVGPAYAADPAIAAVHAIAQARCGRPAAGLGRLLDLVLDHSTDADLAAHRGWLRAAAAEFAQTGPSDSPNASTTA